VLAEKTPSTTLESLYKTMLLTRRFEERILELHGSEIVGSVHPCLGQEAIPAGALTALRSDDRVIATYRGHGWAIACGVPLASLAAEIMGRETGTNGGRAGSAYLTSPAHRFVGENSIVGAGLPIGCGFGIASQFTDDPFVTVVSFGDGATNQGASHEALVFAVARKLPVIFICENNRWSEMTLVADIVPVPLYERAAAYGLRVGVVDGNDPVAVGAAVAEHAKLARQGKGPAFIECTVERLGAHYHADIEHYRTRADKELAEHADPIPRAYNALLATGSAADDLSELAAAVEAELDDVFAVAQSAPLADGSSARSHVYFDAPAPRPTPLGNGKELTYAAAVNAALERELTERSNAILFGEDIAAPGGTFGVTRNLQKQFGDQRVFDTPIAEAAIFGSAIGSALAGMRPVVEIMFGDFALVALDQLVNQAANVSYVSKGIQSCPILVRTQHAVTPGSCAQHTQALEALLAHIPGLRIGLPASPQDAWAMTRAAIASNDPVILYESRVLYLEKGLVDVDAPVESIGGARLLREGDDITLVSWGRMVPECVRAAQQLASGGVSASVVDLRWLNPLDIDTVVDQVKRTTRLLVVHEANMTGGFGAEVATQVTERCFFELDQPPRRIALPDMRVPAAPTLQVGLVPTAASIASAACEVVAA